MDHIHSGKLNGFIPMNFIRSSIFKMPVLQLDKSELSAVGDDDVAMVSLILTPDVGLLRVREVRQLLQLDRQTAVIPSSESLITTTTVSSTSSLGVW